MTTENKNDSGSASKNGHNFSLLPSMLLIIQLLLLLLGVLKIEHELIAAFNSLLETSLIFLNILNVCLVIWYWIKKPVFKQKDFSRKYKATNTIICAANIILLNKFYDNSKLKGMFKSISSLENIEIYVFLIIVAIAAFLIARYMSKENDNGQKEETQSADSSNKTIEEGSGVAKQALTPARKDDKTQSSGITKKERKFFVLVFIVIALLIVLLGSLIISKLNFPTGLLNGGITKENLYVVIGVLIALFFIVPAVLLFLAWVTRLITRFFTRMPEYYDETGRLDKSIIESIVGLVLFLILVFAGNLLGLTGDGLKEKLRIPNFLTLPFLVVFAFAFSRIFTRMFFGFFEKEKAAEEKDANQVMTKIEKTAKDTLYRILRICDGTIKSFFRLIHVFPDFTDSIETVLFGEDNPGTNKAGASNPGQNNHGSGNKHNNQTISDGEGNDHE